MNRIFKRTAALALALCLGAGLLPLRAAAVWAEDPSAAAAETPPAPPDAEPPASEQSGAAVIASGSYDDLFTKKPDGWTFEAQVDDGNGGWTLAAGITHNGNKVYVDKPEDSAQKSGVFFAPQGGATPFYVSFDYAFLRGENSDASFQFGSDMDSTLFMLGVMGTSGTPTDGAPDPASPPEDAWKTAYFEVTGDYGMSGFGFLHKLNSADGAAERVYLSNVQVYNARPAEWDAKVTINISDEDKNNIDTASSMIKVGTDTIHNVSETTFPLTVDTTLGTPIEFILVFKENVEYEWVCDPQDVQVAAGAINSWTWTVTKSATITLKTVLHKPAELNNVQLQTQKDAGWEPVELSARVSKPFGEPDTQEKKDTLATGDTGRNWWYRWEYGSEAQEKFRLTWDAPANGVTVELYDNDQKVEPLSGGGGGQYYELDPGDREHKLRLTAHPSPDDPTGKDSVWNVFLWPTLDFDQAFGLDSTTITNDYWADDDGGTDKYRRPDVAYLDESFRWDEVELTFEFNPDPPKLVEVDGEQVLIQDGAHEKIFTSALAPTGGNQDVERFLTFTAQQPGILTFDYLIYAAPGGGGVTFTGGSLVGPGGGGNTLCEDATESTRWRTYSVTLTAAQQTFTLMAEPKDDESFVAISNVQYLSQKANLTITQEGDGNGTIQGKPEGDVYVHQTLSLTAVPNDDSVFTGWYNENGELLSLSASIRLTIDQENVTVKARFAKKEANVAQIKDQLYPTLPAAIQAAQKGDIIRLIASEVTLNEDAEIPAGVTLLLPCMASDTTGYVNGHAPNGSTPVDEKTGPYYNPSSPYSTLKIGGTLTVKGTVVVNAQVGRSKTGCYDQDVHGGYAVIEMTEGSNIIVENGGLLDVSGYIKGSGTVTAESGGQIRDLYVVRNWRGGSQAMEMYPYVYPMNQSDMHNIEVKTVVKSGAVLSGNVRMYASDEYNYTVFPQMDAQNGLIRVSSGSLTKTLTPKADTEKQYEDREKFVLEGKGAISYSALDIVGMEMSTGDFVYPIDGDNDFEVNGDWTVTDRLKFMPGAIVRIKSGSTLTVQETSLRSQKLHEEHDYEPIKTNCVVFYDSTYDETKLLNGTPISPTSYPTEKRGDAKLILEGGTKFVCEGDFAGKIVIDDTATRENPVVFTLNGQPKVTTQEANGYRKDVVDAYEGEDYRDVTFNASIDGWDVPSSGEYTCWKEGEKTVIRITAPGVVTGETVSTVYGTPGSYDASGVQGTAAGTVSVEYYVDGAWTDAAPTRAGAYDVRAAVDLSDRAIRLIYDGENILKGAFVVKPLPAEFTWTGDTFEYEKGVAQTVTAAIANLVGADQVVPVLAGNEAILVNTYEAEVVRLEGPDAGNYTLVGSRSLTHPWEITQPANAPKVPFPTVAEEDRTFDFDPNKKLSDIPLSFYEGEYGTFAWEEPDTVPFGKATYYILFTPSEDSAWNYGLGPARVGIEVTANLPGTDVDVGVAAANPEIAFPEDSAIPPEDQAALSEALGAGTSADPSPALRQPDVMAELAEAVQNGNLAAELEKLNADASEHFTKVEIVAYLDIQPTAYEKGEAGKLTLDITPMYKVVAVRAGGDLADGVPIGAPQKLGVKVTAPIEITIGLPGDFLTADGSAYVVHESNGKVILGTVGNTSGVTFMSDGFSAYTIYASDPSAAKIGEQGYTSFQDAVNAAQDGDTIELLKDVDGPVSVDRNLTVTVKAEDGVLTETALADLLVPGGNAAVQKDESVPGQVTFTFTVRSVSGGGSSSVSVNTPASTNGSYTVSDRYASAGKTVTVTPKPNEGYAVDQVVVTDKNGNELEVKDNGDGTYSFVMPDRAAQPVTVNVTFVCDGGDQCPSKDYADVDHSKWYHTAVDYAIANGLMDGVAPNTFAPDATTTRAMVVTILYRLEGKPAATASAFADVPAGQWYTDAIGWAAANGVVDGYSPEQFGPNDPVTREQMAAILYRYADYKGYDVTNLADLSGFTDAGSISGWAETAMKWAVGAGLIEGMTPTTLEPAGTSTRAQIATLLMRFCEEIVKK